MSFAHTLESTEKICLDVSEKVLMEVFHLSPREAEFMRPLLYYTLPGPEELPNLKYSGRQIIYTLRKKLEAKYRVRIRSYGGGRYGFSQEDKAILQDALLTSREYRSE
jgi:hypothetical protein